MKIVDCLGEVLLRFGIAVRKLGPFVSGYGSRGNKGGSDERLMAVVMEVMFVGK